MLDILRLPEARLIKDLDSIETIAVHKQIIEKKPFLKRIYFDFYCKFKEVSKAAPKGLLVEIGSGSGFLKEVMPEVITSDVIQTSGIDMTFEATNMPFDVNSISTFFLLNVLHHIKNPLLFFQEANRCLVQKGEVVMIEPYNSIWSNFIYRNFHHEPFNPNGDWFLEEGGRLTVSNQALPWIIFFRDRELFEERFPDLKIKKLTLHTPLLYLLSGGLSIKQLVPSFTYEFVKCLEVLLTPFNKYLAMFVTIELCKEN